MMENQIVLFALGVECLSVDIATAQSTIKVQPITGVLPTQESVEDVTDLRGKTLPVINLRKGERGKGEKL